MSAYTIKVDQFLLNTLQPEIERLNISLLNMEKYGYDNPSMVRTKEKLNKIIPIYDYLYEYTHGNEEANIEDIEKLMSFTGANLLSKKSTQTIIATARGPLSVENNLDIDFLRIYEDGEIKTNNLIYVSDESRDFDIFLPRIYGKIIVSLTINTETKIITELSNHARLADVIIDNDVTNASIEVYGFINPTDTLDDFSQLIEFDIMNSTCIPSGTADFYSIVTQEPFTINLNDLWEASDISITPNDGSNPQTFLDWDWITANAEPKYFEEGQLSTTDVLVTEPGDAHILLAFPSNIAITRVVELVLGTEALMTQGIHYEISDLSGAPAGYKYIYFRDLANEGGYNAIREIHIDLIKI